MIPTEFQTRQLSSKVLGEQVGIRPSGGHKEGRYLVVEPDRSDQVLLRVFFRRSNINDDQLVFVPSPDKIPVDDYRLVLCDLCTGDPTNLDTLHKIQRRLPDCPVVVLTGNGNPTLALEAIRSGAQDFLIKGSYTDHEFNKTIRFAVERHFMQKELQLSREEYVELFDTNPQPSVVYEMDTLQLVKVNRRFCEVYGYSREEALKLTTRDIRAPREHARLESDIACLREHGILDISAIEHRKSNREIITVEVSSQRLRRNGTKLVIATMNDITRKVEFESNLLATNERFKQASIATRDVIYDWNLESNEIIWSDSLKDQFGYEPGRGNFNIQKWTQVIHPEDRDSFVSQLNDLISNGEPHPTWQREYRMRRGDGTFVHVSDRALVIRANDGKGLRIIGAIEDISDRKTAELELENAFRQLQDFNAKYEDLFLEAPAFISYLSGKDHVFQLANPEFLRLVGRQKVIGQPVRKEFPELLEQGFISGLNHVYNTGESISGKEVPIVFKDPHTGASRRAFVNYVYSPSRRHDGLIEGVCLFGVDVTDLVLSRKRIEQASTQLKNIKDNLEALINSTDDLIWSVDRQGALLSANKPFLERVKEITGRTVFEGQSLEIPQLGTGFLKKWKAHFERAFRGERFTIHEESRQSPPRHSVFTFNPIHDEEGKVTGVACYSRDVTERTLQVQAIKEQNRQIKEIAWIQSHVIRAPLARLMGLCSILQYGDFQEKSPGELVQHLKKSAWELDEVIGEISRKTESIDI